MASRTVNLRTEYAKQAEKLSLHSDNIGDGEPSATTALSARFITPRDPVIETVGGERLPPVPLHEALKLNKLKARSEGREGDGSACGPGFGSSHQLLESDENGREENSIQSDLPDASFRTAIPPSRTHPLFPQLPLYGPPSLLRNLQSFALLCTSGVLSLAFLTTIILGSAFTSIPLMLRHIGYRLTFRNPNAKRPFFEEEKRRKKTRKEEARAWYKKKRRRTWSNYPSVATEEGSEADEAFEPTEGGRDPLVCDVGYYARRVGLDVEKFKVQTEDGFIIDLWHVYNPKEQSPSSPSQRNFRGPVVFDKDLDENESSEQESVHSSSESDKKYPVLMMHGLLQSAGAYCCNDDDSLAFFLCKSGYDIWLGNNRCGFEPQHKLLKSSDPRMWNWNIRQMGVMDLPALISRVLSETRFEKLGLICHSQGTTETFVALAKEQRPDLGKKISVFCALAPAVYAGPLIGKMYFKFMRIISPGMFRLMFGVHSFIPFMMAMHSILPGKLYGAMGYRVFAFLFNWTDERWDVGLRDRFFQFAPVYVSAESMRWWLGRECFATQKCILATREEGKQEDEEDEEDQYYNHSSEHPTEAGLHGNDGASNADRGRKAWYDDQAPPFAFWIPASDQLVDGQRLLRRFQRGREPSVKLVHYSIIDEYEHLDVLWAMDAIEKVGKEVREVIWKTAPPSARKRCRVPKECEEVHSLGTQS